MRQEPRDPPGPPTAPRRVLIVDDEPAIHFAYRRLIERQGITVDGCTGFEEAAALLRTRRYGAIVADLRLSGTDNEDGMEVLRLAREVQPEAGVILVTGYGNQEIGKAALALGAAHYYEKPVLPEVILASLAGLMRGAPELEKTESESAAMPGEGAAAQEPDRANFTGLNQ